MKRTIAIILMLCALSTAADAQWYLFPGSKNKKDRNAQRQAREELLRLKEKQAQEAQESIFPAVQADSTLAPEQAQEQTEDQEVQPVPVDDFVPDIPETIEVSLLLPLKSTGRPSGNFYEFYTGALLAASDLGREGTAINLRVFDTADPTSHIGASDLMGSDVTIGPVSSADIRKTLAKVDGDTFLISPLEPRAAALSDSCNVVQVPTPSEMQTVEMVRWLSEEASESDTVYVCVPETGVQTGLFALLENGSLKYKRIAGSDVDSLQIGGGTARFVIASEDEIFVCNAVNSIGSLASADARIILYGTSKYRSYDGIHSESLYRANARIVTYYYVDYTAEEVKDFVRRFRAVYGAEPSSFAFHGYDTMRYFVSVCGKYGRMWRKKLSEYPYSGLQADFNFTADGKTGAVNGATRRVRYYPDLTSFLQ